MTAFLRPYLLGAMRCKACGEAAVYNISDQPCPKNWIQLRAFGIDGYVCSKECIVNTRLAFDRQRKALEKSKKLGPLLPPDVVL